MMRIGRVDHSKYYLNDKSNIVGCLNDQSEKENGSNDEDRISRGKFLIKMDENELEDFLQQKRKCEFCGEVFREADNLGKLKCIVHYGVPAYSTNIENIIERKMTCCGIEPLDRGMIFSGIPFKREYTNFIVGCVRMDHNFKAHKFREIDDIKLNSSYAIKYLPQIGLEMDRPINCRQKEDDLDYAFVRRYDEPTLRALQYYPPNFKQHTQNVPTYYENGKVCGFVCTYLDKFTFFQKEIENEKKNREERWNYLKENYLKKEKKRLMMEKKLRNNSFGLNYFENTTKEFNENLAQAKFDYEKNDGLSSDESSENSKVPKESRDENKKKTQHEKFFGNNKKRRIIESIFSKDNSQKDKFSSHNIKTNQRKNKESKFTDEESHSNDEEINDNEIEDLLKNIQEKKEENNSWDEEEYEESFGNDPFPI